MPPSHEIPKAALDQPKGRGQRGGRVGQALWRLLMSQRVRPLWMLALASYVLFGAFRAGLLWASAESLEGVRPSQIARCFLVGLRYDSVPIGYVLLPLVVALTLAPDRAFQKSWFRCAVTAAASLFLTLWLIVEIIGTAFFLQFQNRLNWLAIDHVDHFSEVASYIREYYPVWILPVGFLAVLIGSLLLFHRWSWHGRRPSGPIWARPIALLVLIAPAALAARGSLSHHAIRFGPAYFCDNKVVAQLSLNNVFTLYNAVVSRLRDAAIVETPYPLPPLDRAKAIVADLLVRQNEELLYPNHPGLWRRVTTGRPPRDYNVVVLIMEGMGGPRVGALGYEPTHTPVLDQLCRWGLYFEQMYGVAGRTSRAVVGILCGHPDLSGRSLMKRSRAQGAVLTLPGVFRDRGYETLFVYGGDPDFDNMKGFFAAGGVQRFVGGDQMRGRGLKGKWGFHDEVVLRKAHETFAALGDRNFFGIILTVSQHEPFEVPAGRVELLPTDNVPNKMINAGRYADWCLGEFFRLARTAPYFKKTIFVLVPDNAHGRHSGYSLDVPSYHIPCLFYAPAIIPPRRVTTVASQTDIAPTLLALLGGDYEHGFLGRNLLGDASNPGFAMVREYDRLAGIRGRRAVVLMPGSRATYFKIDGGEIEPLPREHVSAEQAERLKLQVLSYHTLATHLYLTRSYRRP